MARFGRFQGGRSQSGFTLLEMMVSVSIVFILSVNAKGNFGDLATRARVADIITQISPIKSEIEILFMVSNELPKPDTIISTHPAIKKILFKRQNRKRLVTIRVRVDKNIIEAENGSTNPELWLQGTAQESGIMRWKCGPAPNNRAILRDLLPSTCRANL